MYAPPKKNVIDRGDRIAEQKFRTDRFSEALGEGVDLAFKKLVSEIMKDRALSAKDKALIALACAVAVKCDHCAKRHQGTSSKAGASKEEMLEAAAVAGLARMGSGFNTASILLDDLEK